jgi:site-specific DNA-methyltransferase (adenine-specific)
MFCRLIYVETNRIIEGDALEVIRSLPSESVDLVLTDPPYGNNCAYGQNVRRTIANDEHPLVGLQAVAECFRVLKRNRNAYMFLDVKHLPIIHVFFSQYTSYRIKDFIVWDKVHMGMGHGFRKRHEHILVLEKGKPKYRNFGFPNVISTPRISTEDHPHKKPPEVLKPFILQSTDQEALVLDPFCGSGSTCLAAKQLDRRYIGIELDPQYIEVTKRRLLG